MNVIWIVADTLRQDHLGAYGNDEVHTPALDSLMAKSVRFDRHYAAGFPTMCARADYFTGRWAASFMGWSPLPSGVETLGQILAAAGYHTAAAVDTPFYIRSEMNYDRGFQSFFFQTGQEGSPTRVRAVGNHESRDVVAWRRHESDYNTPQTVQAALRWLERHYQEDFFLLVDTWDPHEPWDAPTYYTQRHMPDYDGEVVQPVYGHWRDSPGMTAAQVEKAHATYMGEIGMVDTWLGHLLRSVENMGLLANTAVVFCSDHGFYFGEHDGLFGKLTFDTKPDGTLYSHGEPGTTFDYSPLYEELVRLPLSIYVPGVPPGAYSGLTSAVDMMPTILDILRQPIPAWVEGHSLLPRVHDPSSPGREVVVSTLPFSNPGDTTRAFDHISRQLRVAQVTTVTAGDWSLLYSTDPGRSALFDLAVDPRQEVNVIADHRDVARELHQRLVEFMIETHLPDHLLEPRLRLEL